MWSLQSTNENRQTRSKKWADVPERCLLHRIAWQPFFFWAREGGIPCRHSSDKAVNYEKRFAGHTCTFLSQHVTEVSAPADYKMLDTSRAPSSSSHIKRLVAPSACAFLGSENKLPSPIAEFHPIDSLSTFSLRTCRSRAVVKLCCSHLGFYHPIWIRKHKGES